MENASVLNSVQAAMLQQDTVRKLISASLSLLSCPSLPPPPTLAPDWTIFGPSATKPGRPYGVTSVLSWRTPPPTGWPPTNGTPPPLPGMITWWMVGALGLYADETYLLDIFLSGQHNTASCKSALFRTQNSTGISVDNWLCFFNKNCRRFHVEKHACWLSEVYFLKLWTYFRARATFKVGNRFFVPVCANRKGKRVK